MPLAQQIPVSFENLRLPEKQHEIDFHKLQPPPERLIGNSPLMKVLSTTIDRFSKHDNPVLIVGENGVGKELIAKTLHHKSTRSSQPFIRITCTSSKDINETEFFGFEKEISPGVTQTKEGKLELADKGTIFINDISEIDLETQGKLFEFLKMLEVKRIGGSNPVQLDVRVIAACNDNLADRAISGTFLTDLYYYLNTYKLEVPPLSARKADIPLIIEFYLKEFSRQMGIEPKKISRSALDLLMNYDWPGNVNELKNIVERAVILGKGDILYCYDFPKYINRKKKFPTLKDMGKIHIRAALKKTGGDKTKAASLLGISRATLYAKLKDYQNDQLP